jgi:hypothetical protein
LVNTKWDEIESDDEDEPVEMCPTSTTFTDINHQPPSKKNNKEAKTPSLCRDWSDR